MLASSSAQILMSPTNNSTAKAHYSFPKAPRFPNSPPQSSNFYNITPALSQRATTFGYGNKSDFTSFKEKTPDPGEYKVSEDIKHTGKAFTFGISRSSSKQHIKDHFIADPSTPGPGTYTISPKFGREGRLITIGGKRQEKKAISESPGPGAYDQKWEISKGTYILSTHKNQVVHKFPPSSYTRFPKLNLDNLPSPGSYNIDKGFLKNSEVLSTVKSPGSTKFTSSSREFMNVQNENPGPGAYRLPSDFGHYESPRKNLD